ncbi:hypothetical protein [Miniimonas sp. S16]|uniref:hypothetical protein n=1 Tax=Miniimonas sp. S16 TaxID=2171623 RepID=UPI000D529EBA|nr:hypothetical protein [Miniimonas sp. S16]
MARRVVGMLLMLLGAASITLGILSATQWRTSDVVTVTTPQADVPYVVVEPGVAGIVNRFVTITVTADSPDQAVAVIFGRDVDVDGWVADAGVQHVTGLADWDALTTEETEGVGDAPDPVGSDMWLRTEQGTGEVSFQWDVPQDRTVLLVARDGSAGPAPTVSFTWERDVETPYLVPLVAAGVAALVIGLGVLIWSFAARTPRTDGGPDGPSAGGSGAEGADSASSADAALVGAGTGATAAAASDGDGAASGEARSALSDPGPETVETQILTRRQLRQLRAVEAGEKPVEEIAAGIAAAPEVASAPDAPDAYPSWLRQGGDGGGEAGATAPNAAAEEAGGDSDAWRRRWGVAAPAAGAGSAAVASEGAPAVAHDGEPAVAHDGEPAVAHDGEPADESDEPALAVEPAPDDEPAATRPTETTEPDESAEPTDDHEPTAETSEKGDER